LLGEQAPDVGTERSASGPLQRDLVDSERRCEQTGRMGVQRVLKRLLQQVAVTRRWVLLYRPALVLPVLSWGIVDHWFPPGLVRGS
jgi:hypothetical protein